MAPHIASMSRNETSIARATIGYSPPNRQNPAYPKPNRTVSSASGQPVIPCRARNRREGTPGVTILNKCRVAKPLLAFAPTDPIVRPNRRSP